MTILVTGGAGFIGSNFIFHHAEKVSRHYRIVCLDKLTYAGNLSTLSCALEERNFRFVRLDICDREGVFRLFEEERPDIVVNFAAESHVDRSIVDPGIFLQTNILGTATLMDACRKFGVRRFHQVSTDEVYGDLPLDKARPLLYGRRRLCTPRALIPRPRRAPIFSSLPITGRTLFPSPSPAVPTITGPIISPKSSSLS